MILACSILAGLVWGALFGFLNLLLTKKVAAGGSKGLAALSMLRLLLDFAALAIVYFTRSLLPLRFEFVMIAAAVTLSLIGIVSAFRIASKMK